MYIRRPRQTQGGARQGIRHSLPCCFGAGRQQQQQQQQLPRCFPIRELSFEQKEQQEQEQRRGGGAVAEQEEKVAKIILFYGFQKLH